MMCLSQTTGYAIRALGCLGDDTCHPHLIRDVARCSGVSKPYLAKVFNKLASSGLVTAKRGYRGGIALSRPAGEIALLEIVKAVEGEKWIGPCLLGIEECEASQICPTSDLWKRVSREIEAALKTTTLADMIAAMKKLRASGSPENCCREPASPAGLKGRARQDDRNYAQAR